MVFVVITVALLTSWIVAIVFTPFIGYHLLDVDKLRKFGGDHHADIYDTPFYRKFRHTLEVCLTHRWKVISATLAVFVLSLVAFHLFVQKQFFPHADRPQLIVDIWLPQGASIQATTRSVERVEKFLAKESGIESFSSYIGSGAPRFYLPQDPAIVLMIILVNC